MKTLFTVLTLSFLASAAIAANNCPQSLSFAANKVSVVEGNHLSAKLDLIESSYTKCSYRGVDQDGAYVSASIQRGTRRGQTAQGTLHINFESLYLKTMTKLKSISSSKVSIESSSYRGVRKATPTTIYSTQTNKVVAIIQVHSVKTN